MIGSASAHLDDANVAVRLFGGFAHEREEHADEDEVADVTATTELIVIRWISQAKDVLDYHDVLNIIVCSRRLYNQPGWVLKLKFQIITIIGTHREALHTVNVTVD